MILKLLSKLRMGVERKQRTPVPINHPESPGMFPSCVGGECLAQGEVFNAHICFLRALPSIYNNEAIDIHADESEHLDVNGRLHRSIHTKGDQFTRANRKIARTAEQHLGPDAALTAATSIMSELTPLVNQLFYSNVRENHAGRRLAPTWNNTSPDTVASIRRKFKSILKREKYQTYLEESPETATILSLFANVLPELTDPDAVLGIFARIDELSLGLYNRGLPVFIVPKTEYYSSMGNSRNRPITPEATIRLLMPAPEEERAQCRRMESHIWREVLKHHPDAFHLTKPKLLLGKWIMSAGSDVPSITPAERLSVDTLMLVNNLYKNFERVNTTAKLSNVSLTPSDIRGLMVFAYLAHEFGHFHYDVADRTLEELDTDLTMFHTIFTLGPTYGFTTEQLVCFVLGDYAKQTMQDPTPAITTDGYRLSGMHLIEGLRRGGYIRLENNKIIISEGTPDPKILLYHTAIHEQDYDMLQEILSLELSDEGQQIVDLILNN